MPAWLVTASMPLVGALMPLAFAPYGYWPLALVAPALLIWACAEARAGLAFLRGWLFGLGYFGFGIYWIYISTHVYAQAPEWLALLLTASLAAYLALYPATVMAVARRWFTGSPLAYGLAVAACWALAEWMRSWLLTGFPWLSIGYSQIDSPLRGYAPVLGVFGVGLLLLLATALLVQPLLDRHHSPRPLLPMLGLLLLVIGQLLTLVRWTEPAGPPVNLLVVQGNIPQDKKWLPEWRRRSLQRYAQLSRDNWQGHDAVIWPEVAVPATWGRAGDTFLQPLAAEAAAADVDLLTGLLLRDAVSGGVNNSVVVPGEEPQFYRKVHLVPFGEYFPVPDFVRSWLKALQLPHADTRAGRIDQPLLRLAGWPIGMSICYEDIFGGEVAARAANSAWLVNVSNDAWFGDSLAPHQHMEMARKRALETGRYLVRATNTGVSAAVDPQGLVTSTLPQFNTGTLSVMVEPYRGETPYVRWGSIMVLWAVAALLVSSRWLSCKSKR